VKILSKNEKESLEKRVERLEKKVEELTEEIKNFKKLFSGKW
jgi:archaellum component FlaC